MRHGTTYSYKKCKCDVCKQANALRRALLREKHHDELKPDDPRHGKQRLYYTANCRCRPCCEYELEYQRLKRANRKNRNKDSSQKRIDSAA